MPGVRGRLLDDVLRTLGSDQTEHQPVITRLEAGLSYQLDDLSKSLPPRSHARMYVHLGLGAVVAQFSGFSLMASRGFWISKLAIQTATTNVIVQLLPSAASAAVATPSALSGFATMVSMPESAEFQQQAGTLASYTRPAAAGFPELFAFAQAGAFAAIGTGVFYIAGMPVLEDFWVQPGTVLEVMGVTANTAISIDLQLEFVADHLFTGQA